ncbi:hypothetical protein M407DRAFT_246407 [Tulasnella calospora MUT 4182]|uniref:Membrane fraction protein n=1 Tax=Tulasnella calospora MUT 4182 TaxID=1051891 RepID=A0A0C3Q5A4_9AGAM|nr:hypothetical protein M407DRAFT_246407 [Tulasnella calospora MUT 4182]
MPCCKIDSNSSCSCGDASTSSPISTAHEQQASEATIVALPRRKDAAESISKSTKPPVWAIDDTVDESVDAPLPAKCDRHVDDRNGVCCKDLRGVDQRTLIDPDVVRDVIIGLSDGLTVPFALTAGLSGIGSSRIVVLGGLAELIAGAISMGIGGFLASQSERDHFRYLRQQTRERVQRSCGGEMEREVHGVLGPLGVDEKVSMAVAENLRKVEDEMLAANGGYCAPEQNNVGGRPLNGSANGDVEGGADRLKWSEDVGLTAFLLKFSEGMEEVPTKRLYISALTIGSGYFFGGLIPLMPYFFIDDVQTALIYSCIVTGVILLIFGAVKTYVTGASGGYRGYAWGAISMLMVGGGAAAAAFGIVKALEVSE